MGTVGAGVCHRYESRRGFYTDVMNWEAQQVQPRVVQLEHFAVASDESLSGAR
jgi:hypothetical protein